MPEQTMITASELFIGSKICARHVGLVWPQVQHWNIAKQTHESFIKLVSLFLVVKGAVIQYNLSHNLIVKQQGKLCETLCTQHRAWTCDSENQVMKDFIRNN